MKKPEKKYDVFISYRRDGGAETAKHLRDALTERGYRVFLDVESLRNGPFNKALYEVIENTKDFVLILPANGLDRCLSEDDWVRLEIEHAKACGKNIVPVMLKGFSFPKELPESIDFIRFQSAPPTLEINYFDAYVSKLQTFLSARPRPLWKKVLTACSAFLLLCAIAFGIYYSTYTYPLKKADQNLVSSLINYIALNMKQVDIAGSLFNKELDRVLEFIEGKTTDSESAILLELSNYREEIKKCRASITSMPDQLRQQLMTSRFDVGDLDTFKPALLVVLDQYTESLGYIRDEMIGSGLRTEHKAAYIKMMKGIAELDAEMLFYQLNETLLPVTNDNALTVLKNKLLPEMSFIYGRGLYLTHDREELSGKMDAVYLKYEKLVNDYGESLEREEEHVDPKQTLADIESLIAFAEAMELDTGDLEARRERILAKLEELESKQLEVVALQKEIEQKKAEAYEKFKPLPEDDQSTLWGKGKRFLTIKMPEAAAECFSLYAKNGENEDYLLGTAALRFAENCTALELQGGVAVGVYEEGKPHQAVQIGDIIYEVDGTPIHNYMEYKDAISEDRIHPIRVFRITETAYELTESVIDTSLGRIGVGHSRTVFYFRRMISDHPCSRYSSRTANTSSIVSHPLRFSRKTHPQFFKSLGDCLTF